MSVRFLAWYLSGLLSLTCVLFSLVTMVPDAESARIVTVVICPWLPDSLPLVRLFAGDVTVRRTALASAAALTVTAFVFFRPGATRPKKPSPNEPPPGNMAGA